MHDTLPCFCSSQEEGEGEGEGEGQGEEGEGEDEPDLAPSLEAVLTQLGLTDLMAIFQREQVDFDSLVSD